MDEIEALKERVEKLEQEQVALKNQVLKLSKSLEKRQTLPRQKPQVIVGPNEGIRPTEIRPDKPRPGDPYCTEGVEFS